MYGIMIMIYIYIWHDEDYDYYYSITMMMMSTDYDKDNYKNRHRCVDYHLYATSSYMHLLHMFLRHSVLTVTFIYHRMVKMLSIMPVNIKNGMLRSFSS